MLRCYRLLFIMGFFSAVFFLTISVQAQECIPVDLTPVAFVPDGVEGYDTSREPDISADGRFVAFESYISNLVANDTNNLVDVFVYDRRLESVSRVSVATGGIQANDNSALASISADGRFVAFESETSNLVPGDTNGYDIFVHDRQTGETTRVSVSSDGTQANNHSSYPSISANGRFVVFHSTASNLVPGIVWGIFMHDRQTGETTYIAPSSDAAISGNGRFLAFNSTLSTLGLGDNRTRIDAFVLDRETGTTILVSGGSDGAPANGDTHHDATISSDGRFIAFGSRASNLVAGDTNGVADVFVYDRETGATSLVSVASDGTQGDGGSAGPALSADGRFVAFISDSSNLVPNDTNFCDDAPNCPDIFLHDRQTRKTTRLSLSPNGVPLDMYFANPVLSADGQIVVFETGGGPFDADDIEKVGNLYHYSVFMRSTACLTSSATAAPERNGFWNGTTLTWNPISWATAYHVQVATDSAFKILIEDKTFSADTLSLPLTNPARVTHYWRVQAKKPDGSWGAWSTTETFVIR